MKTHTLIRTLSIVAVVAGLLFAPGPLSSVEPRQAPGRHCALKRRRSFARRMRRRTRPPLTWARISIKRRASRPTTNRPMPSR